MPACTLAFLVEDRDCMLQYLNNALSSCVLCVRVCMHGMMAFTHVCMQVDVVMHTVFSLDFVTKVNTNGEMFQP